MRHGVVIKTVINGMVFDGATKDPMQKAVRDALIGFMAALGQAQAEATKLAQQAGIAHAQANGHRVYLGRKPTYNREQLARIMDLLDHQSDITIAREVGLDRLAIRRIREDPAKAEAALVAWDSLKARPRQRKPAQGVHNLTGVAAVARRTERGA